MNQNQINQASESLQLITQFLNTVCNGTLGPLQQLINQAKADAQSKAAAINDANTNQS